MLTRQPALNNILVHSEHLRMRHRLSPGRSQRWMKQRCRVLPTLRVKMTASMGKRAGRQNVRGGTHVYLGGQFERWRSSNLETDADLAEF